MADLHTAMPNERLEGAAIQALLAHCYPFLLVDRIDIVQPGQRVIGTKRITAGEWWNEGGDSQLAVFPFSLVIEAMAQTSGALMRDLTDSAQSAVAYFMGVNRVRFRSAARAGDELTMELTLRQWRRGLCRTHGVATVNQRLVASAELTTIVRGVA